MQVVNIGPGFRPNYGDFVPRSPFPLLSLWDGEEQGTPRTSLERLKRASKEQEELNVCAQGYDVQRLGKMVGAYAPHCVSEMEDLYRSMQAKLEAVASAVGNSSSRVRLEVRIFFVDLMLDGAGCLLLLGNSSKWKMVTFNTLLNEKIKMNKALLNMQKKRYLHFGYIFHILIDYMILLYVRIGY